MFTYPDGLRIRVTFLCRLTLLGTAAGSLVMKGEHAMIGRDEVLLT